MKLLVLSPKAPWVLGGVEKVVKETTMCLLGSRDITLEIWCKGPKNETIFWNGLKVRMFRSFFGFSPSMIKELKKSQSKFDVIHIHGTSNLYPLEALLTIKKWEKVVISSHYHPHGSTLLFKWTKPIYDMVIVSQYLKMANKVVCVSKTEKGNILSKFKLPRDKLRVIPNGVPIEKIRVLKSKGVQKKNEISILYFGRLERYKNIHVVIEALKYLPETFVFYIVGKGPYENELRKLAEKLNLDSRVKFLGFLPEEDLYVLLNSVNIVINLSEIEAFGIMVVEALAAGKPVVVNDKEGLKELARYFNDMIYPIPTLDPRELASLLTEIAQKRKFKATNLPRFNWENILEDYLKLYVRMGDLGGDGNHGLSIVFKNR